MTSINDTNEDLQKDLEYLTQHLKCYPDFPKPGINFRDTFSLFRQPDCFDKIINIFSNHISNLNCEVIVGLEARGFILGAAIAYKLKVPFVPIRKKGKLPGRVISYSYDLEYGQDVFEVQEDSMRPNARVVIVDDLVATGGSCAAAIELLKKLDANVVECVMLVELTSLDWRAKIKSNLTSFLKFE